MEERRKDGDMLERVVRLETQVWRLVSDAESEKETRRRVADAIDHRFIVSDERLRKLERTIWTASGALAIIILLANLAERFLGRT